LEQRRFSLPPLSGRSLCAFVVRNHSYALDVRGRSEYNARHAGSRRLYALSERPLCLRPQGDDGLPRQRIGAIRSYESGGAESSAVMGAVRSDGRGRRDPTGLRCKNEPRLAQVLRL